MYIGTYYVPMATLKVSATKARNNFFELLNLVSGGTKVIVEKDAKEIAVIMPKETGTDLVGLKKAMADLHGAIPSFISPLRNSGSKKFLGEWDKKS